MVVTEKYAHLRPELFTPSDLTVIPLRLRDEPPGEDGRAEADEPVGQGDEDDETSVEVVVPRKRRAG